MKGDYKSNFFDENKRLEKAYYSNTLQRSQKCFRFSASVHFNQLFLRTNRNQIQHIRQPKTVKKKYETSRNAYKELDLRVRRVSQKIFKIELSFLIQIKGCAIDFE